MARTVRFDSPSSTEIRSNRSSPAKGRLGRLTRLRNAMPISDLGGIHLTGGTPLRGSPRAIRGGALQARWFPARLGWRWRPSPRPSVDDEVLVAHRIVGDGELEHAVEHHSAAARTATVEAEHELVQVARQVRLVHRALVGSQQPPLRQRGDPVYRGQQRAGVLTARPSSSLTPPIVDVAKLFQPAVALPAVCDDRCTWLVLAAVRIRGNLAFVTAATPCHGPGTRGA